MEMSQNEYAHHRHELVVGSGFSKMLKVWSSDMLREDFERLASNHED